MKERTILVKNDTIVDFSYFIKNMDEKTPKLTNCHTKDFSIFYVIRILNCLKDKSLNFSELYRQSGIAYKSTYIRYLALCRDFKFANKQVISSRLVSYSITAKGKTLLELFRI
jgi:hypothetical protein